MDHKYAYIMASIGSIVFLFWFFLFLKFNKKFIDIIHAIDPREFFLPQLYFIGFGCIEIFKINIFDERFRGLHQSLVELKGNEAANFYQPVILGAQLTYILSFIPLGMFLGCFTDEFIFGILGVLTGMVLAYYIHFETRTKLINRRNEINALFPEVLSKLTLLCNAGLVLRESWSKVAFSSNELLYREMQFTSEEIRNGLSEQKAISNFAQRCATKEIRKFATIVIQNIQKGSVDLTNSLVLLTNESWEIKRHEVKKKSELAGQKLLIPIGIMFVGILLMIIVPIFANIF